MGTTPMKSRGNFAQSDRRRTRQRSPRFLTKFARPVVGALVAAAVVVPSPAQAQSWRIESAFSAQETVTNNVNLAPNDSRRSDWITEMTPSLRISEKGARTSLSAFLSVPVVLYARTGGENNTAYPSADVLGDIKLVDDWLHLEGQVTVTQQYFNPFGSQPLGFDNATQNRVRSDTYRISPYIHDVTPGRINYELRNNNVWSSVSGAPVNTNDFHYTEFTGNASKTDTTIGWQAAFDVNDIAFRNAYTFRTRAVRLGPLYNIDPQLRLTATIGYEADYFQLENFRGAIYGAGFEWRPTLRTSVVGSWEHRFFGPAYQFSFDHRMALSVWKLSVSRNITTTPQQLASLPAGGDLSALLNGLFLSTIPDPVQRQQTIDQFIRDRGLTSTLSSGLNLYSQQILLQESQTASVGLLGKRNTLLLTIYNIRSEPIAESTSPLAALLATSENNRQTGGSLLWSHKLTASVRFDATIERFRTVANAPLEGRTNQTALRLVVSTPLSAKTTMFAGARYQTLSSDVSSDYNEAAAFIGVTHTFR